MTNHILKMPLKLLLILILVTSCSSNDDHDSSGNHYKISVTLNHVSATYDYVSVVAVGSSITGNNTYPMWKVNSQEIPETQTVSLDKNDFTGSTSTYIIETVNPIDILTVGTQIINYGENLTGSVKVEKNGSVKVNETINLVGDNTDFTENYSFNN